MRIRKVTVLVDEDTLSKIEDLKVEKGFITTSEAFRYVIRKGLDVVEREASQTMEQAEPVRG